MSTDTKTKNQQEVSSNRFFRGATLRYLKIAPRKVRLVADTLRGLSLQEAEAQLLLRPHRSAQALLKLVRSARANIKNNNKATDDNVVIKNVRVDQGPMLKRVLPRAMGRATPIHKIMSHVMLELERTAISRPARFIINPPVKKEGKKKSVKTEKGKSKTPPRDNQKAETRGGFFRRFFRRKSV